MSELNYGSADTERKAAHIAIGHLSDWIVEQDQTIQAQSAVITELMDACKQAAVLHEDDEGIAQVLLAAIAKAEGRS
jgi:hypothetical protein